MTLSAARKPGYLRLKETGELDRRTALAERLLSPCHVCPRRCGVNRLRGEQGFCRTTRLPVIASSGPHFGEEPPLVGRGGSGTIFAARCNLACIFCQNFTISREGRGIETSPEDLAGLMLRLQNAGCHNINIVTPTHIVPQLIESIAIAAGRGLCIPIVYNSGGYDSVETLRLLDGIIDIYMPDAKYGDNGVAAALSGAPDYVAVMQAALTEMHRQVGDLVIQDGIAVRGVLVRHLVLPENLAGSDVVLPWIARNISPDTYVNIMDQYRWPHSTVPAELVEKDSRYRELIRPMTDREYARAIRIAEDAGLHRGFVRDRLSR